MALALLLVAHTARGQSPRLRTGVYVVTRVNRQPLPAADRLPTVSGMEQAVRLEEGVLRLRPDGRFVAAVRYHRALVKPGAPLPRAPLLDGSTAGRFVLRDGRLTLVPDRHGKGRPPAPLVATVSAPGRLTLPVVYQAGSFQRTYVLELRYDPTRW